jgi:MSHA biogenesis protein MshG
MPHFYYKARDRKGSIVTGRIDAPNSWMAKKNLNKMNLVVLEVNRFNLKGLFQSLNEKVEEMSRTVTLEEKLVVMSQIETGMSVGIPIIQMMHILQEDVQNKFLRESISEISHDISQGSTLHEAFAKHHEIFDSTVIGLIKTGESTGKLDETLHRINQMIEKQGENRAKVKSATFYPKIVLFVMTMVTGVIVYFVIPKLKDFLAGFRAELPPITQFVVGVSDAFINYWYLILIGGIVIRKAFLKYIETQDGKRQFDLFKLKVPGFGIIFHYLELNNFCFVLELLISSGVPLIDALEILKESQHNHIFKEAIGKCQEVIDKGGTLVKGMESSFVFPSSFRNLLAMGEETGRMQPVLSKMGRYYQLQIDHKLDNLSKLIEPILLFFIFGMVLIIALAVFLPIWKMNAVQRGGVH